MLKKLTFGVFVLIAVVSFYSCMPRIANFAPKRGGEGTEVTISGENFNSSLEKNTVRVGDVKAQEIVQASENQIVFRIPPAAKTGKISVETTWGIVKSAETFVIGKEKGYALAIGLNAVDPNHYAGWDGKLNGCEPDAKDMADIGKKQGLNVETLITTNATREAVLTKLAALAEVLNSGDLLVVSYSGHGGQIPDQNGDEADQSDETWCLYNGELLDDELYQAWSKFRDGVRILVFSDSCHSGTVLKMIKSDYETPSQVRIEELTKNLDVAKSRGALRRDDIRSFISRDKGFRDRIRESVPSVRATFRGREVTDAEVEAVITLSSPRVVPWYVLKNTYEQNRQFYDDLGRTVPKEDPAAVRASVILISGCEDNQVSMDVGTNGLFTLMLKQVWNNGSFSGNHLKFHINIREQVLKMNEGQSPYFYNIGANDTFLQQRPYTI